MLQILKVSTEDKIILKAFYFSNNKSKKRLILHIPGMSGSIYYNSFYEAMYSGYPKNGLDFIVAEHRGVGVITQFATTTDDVVLKGTTFDSFGKDVLKDLDAWINIAIRLGYKEIWLQGHSYGCNKIIYYILQRDIPEIKGLILLSPSLTYEYSLCDEWKDDHKETEQEALSLVKQGKSDNLLQHRLWGTEILTARTYLSLFGKDSPANIFKYVSNRNWDFVNSIKLPVIAFTGTKDEGPCINQHEAMHMLKRELKKSPRVKTIVFPNAEHDFCGFGNQIVEHTLSFIKNS